jgi:TPR repeat protein
MKSVLFTVAALLFTALYTPVLLANQAQEMRAEAEQYYADADFKKAYKLYLKLAQSGDRYSQRRIAHMYAEGEGKSASLTESYAWSILAAEGNEEQLATINQDLLPKIENASKAEKKAAKLTKKYGKAAQKERVARHNQRGRVLDEGSCTGSKLACPRG